MKKKITITYIYSFTFSIALFGKVFASNPCPFHKPRCLSNLQRENRGKPAFPLCDVLESPNECRFTELLIIHFTEK